MKTIAVAVPQNVVPKRQAEVVAGVVVHLIDKVLHAIVASQKKQAQVDPKADSKTFAATKWPNGFRTEYGCITGEKKVHPDFVKDFLKPKCSEMTHLPEGSTFVTEFPEAKMSQKWSVRQGSHGGNPKDWVDIVIAWAQAPDFQGEKTTMSTALCEIVIEQGLTICQDEIPVRTQGFNAIINGEWYFQVDITNIPDKPAEKEWGQKGYFPEGVQSASGAEEFTDSNNADDLVIQPVAAA